MAEFIGTPAKLEFVDPNGETILEGGDIQKAEAVQNSQTLEYAVSFELTQEGSRKNSPKLRRNF